MILNKLTKLLIPFGLTCIVTLLISFGYQNTENAKASSEYVKGIDIRDDVDWSDVNNKGYQFAFVKATEGIDWSKSGFEDRVNKAKQAGLLVGVYHFARPINKAGNPQNDAEAEAESFINLAGDYIREGYLRPTLDIEDNSYGEHPELLGKEPLAQWIKTWMDTVELSTGVQPMLYMNPYLFEFLSDSSIANLHDAWMVDFRETEPVFGENPDTKGWNTWSFWQYKWDVHFSQGQADLNVFNGDFQELLNCVISPPGIAGIIERETMISDIGDPLKIPVIVDGEQYYIVYLKSEINPHDWSLNPEKKSTVYVDFQGNPISTVDIAQKIGVIETARNWLHGRPIKASASYQYPGSSEAIDERLKGICQRKNLHDNLDSLGFALDAHSRALSMLIGWGVTGKVSLQDFASFIITTAADTPSAEEITQRVEDWIDDNVPGGMNGVETLNIIKDLALDIAGNGETIDSARFIEYTARFLTIGSGEPKKIAEAISVESLQNAEDEYNEAFTIAVQNQFSPGGMKDYETAANYLYHFLTASYVYEYPANNLLAKVDEIDKGIWEGVLDFIEGITKDVIDSFKHYIPPFNTFVNKSVDSINQALIKTREWNWLEEFYLNKGSGLELVQNQLEGNTTATVYSIALAQGSYNTIDQEHPNTWIIGAPPATVNSKNVTITWEGQDDTTPKYQLIYYYKLTGTDSAWHVTSDTRKTYTNLPEKEYTFMVYAVDRFGKVDSTPAQVSFTISSFPVTAITEVKYPDEITVNQWATILVKVVNHADEAKWQTISVSFPQGIDTNDIEILEYNLDNACIYDNGTSMRGGYGTKTIQLQYPVVEGVSSPWENNTERYMQLRVKPQSAGLIDFYVKSVAGRQPEGLVASWDPVSGVKDQQDEFVKVYTFNVNELPDNDKFVYPIDSIDFGTVQVGNFVDKSTIIRNGTIGSLTIDEIVHASGSNAFSHLDPGVPFSVGPDGTRDIVMRFTPTSEGTVTASFTLISGEEETSFSVIGNGIPANQQPYQPSYVLPSDDSLNVPVTPILSWMGGDPDTNDTVYYDVFMGTTSSPSYIDTIGPYPATQDQISYNPDVLEYETKYYWRIQTKDQVGAVSSSPVWYFTTEVSPAIGYTPYNFTFTAIEGGMNPSDQCLYIWNSGSGILEWIIETDVNWLKFNRQSGITTDDVDIVHILPQISGLKTGVYSGTVWINSSSVQNTDISLDVRLIIYPSDTWRRVFHIPEDSNSIQDTIARAASWPGSTILVGPGEYDGPIRLLEGVNLIGVDPATTIINARPEVADFVVSGANNSVISGFTIQGGTVGIDCGLYAMDTSPEITNVRLVQNSIAIAVGKGASPIIMGNTIDDVDMAIRINGGSPIIKNNVIHNISPLNAIEFLGNANGVLLNNVIDSIGDPDLGFGQGNSAIAFSDGENTALIKNNTFSNVGTCIRNVFKKGIYLGYNNYFNTNTEYFDGDYGLPAPGYGNLRLDPIFINSAIGNFHLDDSSPLIDNGDPTPEYIDVYFPPSQGTTLNDIGAYGGPWSTTQDNPPSIIVTSPNGGEELETLSVYPIRWIAVDDIGVAGIDIQYSDDGTDWEFIAENETNKGVYTWTVPDSLTNSGLVRIIAKDTHGQISEDITDSTFSIIPNTGPSWEKTAIEQGIFTSLTTVNGNPAMSYTRQISDNGTMKVELRYAIREEHEWHFITLDNIHPDLGTISSCSIAVDSEGNPAISYVMKQNFEPSLVKYVAYNGSSWNEPEIIDSSSAIQDYVSLAFSPSGIPSVAYSNGHLRYACFSDQTWLTETVDTINIGPVASLAFDTQENPGISYYWSEVMGDTGPINKFDLRYAYFDGTNWIKDTVDEAGAVGYRSSILYDSNDNPVIAYSDDTNAPNNILKFIRFDGTDWGPPEVIDETAKCGVWPSLAFDIEGYPSIAYVGSYRLKFARFNGSEWNMEIVDNDGENGEYNSLAYNDQGNPMTSYYGNNDGQIRFAQLISGDVTSPTTPEVMDEGLYTSNSKQLSASWNATDQESGITEYQYCIGTTQEGKEVVDWTSVGANTKVIQGNLNLSIGNTYYFAVKARNGAGLWSSVGISDGIIIQNKDALTSIILPVDSYWHNTEAVNLAFNAGDDYNLTSVSLKYRYSNDSLSWTTWKIFEIKEVEGESASGLFCFNWPEGQGYYEFCSIATDESLDIESTPSVGDTCAGYDLVPPSNPVPPSTEIYGVQWDEWQIEVTDPEFAWYSSSDDRSGIDGYYIYWGSSWNGTSDNYNKNPSFHPDPVEYRNRYFLRVCAKDKAGNTANQWITLFIFKYGSKSILTGDATDDGIVNVKDMTKVAKIILMIESKTPGTDVNMDGAVNVLDMTRIARIILGLE